MIHRRLLQLAGAVPGAIAALAAVGVLISALHVTFAFVTAAVIAALVRGEGDVGFALIVLVVVALARAGVIWLREPLAARIGASVRIALRRRLLARTADIAAAERRSGDTAATVIDGVDGLDAYYTRYLPQLVVVLLVPATIIALVSAQDVGAGAVLAVAGATAVIVPRFWDARLLRNGRSRWAAFARLSGDYVESLQSIPLLRAFGAAERFGTGLEQRAEALRLSTMAQMRVSLIESGLSALAMHLGTVLAVLAAASAVLTGSPATTAIVVLLLSRECFRPLSELSTHWHAGYLGLTAVDGLDRLLSLHATVPDDGTVTTPAAEGAAIAIRDLTYRYPGTDSGIRGITLEIESGETVAILGASGSGKSTLGRLLEREVDPDEGDILLDGIPLPQRTRSALARSVVTVPQDPVLFAWSVQENLRLYRQDASDAEMQQAAVAADIDQVIRDLPEGYDTVLGENGDQLSGGQRQRLAIARALVARAPVLILDEVTSALDAETERRVMDGVDAHDPRRTTILIAHRESACIHADRWIALDQGGISSSGDGPPPARGRPHARIHIGSAR
ncbi:ABC transporter ATP-binding protein/permease [Microbacterium murale]|uniref:ABC-type transport system involved in cytochrome bd biosynthesis fused ATPase/permease subunit n=1 Tax=Microbacterium murale TaxID=1081040 RepID=A0ABU0PBK1_9MICO|nr:ATP-binding cassette domain-containing protein [Microbacterium murale]MDQ0644710.1 ABC-type transport system involved in cytochrome bd biosynthesis fused ATPase/permease subunit [Microbacterium murale]